MKKATILTLVIIILVLSTVAIGKSFDIKIKEKYLPLIEEEGEQIIDEIIENGLEQKLIEKETEVNMERDAEILEAQQKLYVIANTIIETNNLEEINNAIKKLKSK